MNSNLKKMILTSLFIALGVILPQFFHPLELGKVISPMHFPVLICGLLLGAYYGAACGFLTPIVASFIFGRPPIFSVGLPMAIELAVYGFVSGLLYTKVKLIKKDIINIYGSLILAMLSGRVIATLVNAIYMQAGLSNNNTAEYLEILFIIGLPGILLQIVMVPPIVLFIKKNIHKDFV